MAKRRMFPGGLRAQLLLGLSLLLIATFALVGLVVENVVSSRLHEARVHEAYRVARAALSLSDVGMSLQPRGLERLASRTDSRMLGLMEGGELAHVHGDPQVIEVWTEVRDEFRGEGPDARYRYVSVEDEPAVVASVGERGHRAVVVLGLSDVRRRITQTRELIWVFFIVVAVFILALGYAFFTFVVMRPLRAIGVATERASSGDLASPISVLPRNEFGAVGRSFNQMLERLENNREELERRLEELERANTELKRTQDSLVRSEKLASVGHLAAGIAHEVGNPLAAISGYNDLLRDGDLDPDQVDDLLERTGDQLDRIRDIIRSLLDFSRQEEDDPEPTDLGACVREAHDLVRALPRARGVDFRLGDLDGEAVVAQESKVVQVLVNVCINALDAMAEADIEEPWIRLEREEEGERVILRIRDRGPGIDEEELSRIFDPFFTTKEPGEGTGLGLAISLRIMESFGGDISIESTSDEGTIFRLEFLRAGFGQEEA